LKPIEQSKQSLPVTDWGSMEFVQPQSSETNFIHILLQEEMDLQGYLL